MDILVRLDHPRGLVTVKADDESRLIANHYSVTSASFAIFHQPVFRAFRGYQEINIACSSSHWNSHTLEHQTALENKVVDMRRLGQPIEEPFHPIVLKDFIEETSALVRLVLQPRLNGRGNLATSRFIADFSNRGSSVFRRD